MNNLIKAGVAVSALATLITSAFAASPITGVWHGRISFDNSKMTASTDKNQLKLRMDQEKVAEQTKITLTLKSDHTFSVVSIGGPRQMPPTTGTYTESGNSITILAKEASGKQGRPQTFNVSKDGHSFVFTQGPLIITFSR